MNDLLGEALVEHGIVEFSLYQVDQALGKPDFDFKAKVLKELVEHHVEEEESELFPQVEKALAAEKLESLGEELLDAFEEAQSEDYHDPLFENLRQVMVGALKPVVPDVDERAEAGDSSPAKRKARKTA